jgi:hypothetical protein
MATGRANISTQMKKETTALVFVNLRVTNSSVEKSLLQFIINTKFSQDSAMFDVSQRCECSMSATIRHVILHLNE